MPNLQNIYLSFQEHTVFQNLNMVFPEKKITAVMGPSGCGKTTCLRLLAGLTKPDAGTVSWENSILQNRKASLSFLPQNLALLPWLSVEQNILLALGGKKEKIPYVRDWICQVGLNGFEKNYPGELSGGMCQRVALARTLCVNRPLLLLDEPFQGLDQELHQKMLLLLEKTSTDKTLIFVTHDPTDCSIADYIATFRYPGDNTPLFLKNEKNKL